MSLLGAAGIGAGANLLGGLLGRSSERRAADRAEYWNQASHALARESFDWNKSYIQNRVADAKKAGIHPLYALGTPGAGASFSAGQAPTGSALGTGIARAGEAAASMLGRRKKDPLAALQADHLRAQIGATNAQGARDNAEALLASSRMKRLEQEALVRPTTYGVGEKPSTGPNERTVNTPFGSITVPKGLSSAQDAENWFGEGGDIFSGLANLVESVLQKFGLPLDTKQKWNRHTMPWRYK